jgi:hypothetical protein
MLVHSTCRQGQLYTTAQIDSCRSLRPSVSRLLQHSKRVSLTRCSLMKVKVPRTSNLRRHRAPSADQMSPCDPTVRVLHRRSLSKEYCLHWMSSSHLALQASMELIIPASVSLSLSQPVRGADMLGRMYEWNTSLCRRTASLSCVCHVQ